MKQLALIAILAACLGLTAGCSVLGPDCGCAPEPICEPVYVSPCCPAPSQGLGFGGAVGAPARVGGAGGSCGG